MKRTSLYKTVLGADPVPTIVENIFSGFTFAMGFALFQWVLTGIELGIRFVWGMF